MNTEKHLIYLRIITTTLLVFGGITWGIIGSLGFNPISRSLKLANLGFLSQSIYIMVGISAILYLYFFYNTNTFIPFLSEAVFPVSLISQTQPQNYNHEITLNAPKDAIMIVFWAADSGNKNSMGYEPSSPLAAQNNEHRPPDMYKTPKEAYNKYENSGSVKVKDGKVVIHLKKPLPYHVYGKTFPSHVHYRWVKSNGILGDVNTLYI